MLYFLTKFLLINSIYFYFYTGISILDRYLTEFIAYLERNLQRRQSPNIYNSLSAFLLLELEIIRLLFVLIIKSFINMDFINVVHRHNVVHRNALFLPVWRVCNFQHLGTYTTWIQQFRMLQNFNNKLRLTRQ